MIAIIVGTHGHFAEELVKTSEMICGQSENLRTITLIPGEGAEDLYPKYQTAVKELDTTDGLIIMNDLFGGTPYNAACRIAASLDNTAVVTGVSLPMLIEMLSLQMGGSKMSPDELIDSAVSASQTGVKSFQKSMLTSVTTDNELG